MSGNSVDRAHLEAERAEHTHYVVPATGEKRCCLCLSIWPCEQSEILDLALSAEGYRNTLESYRAAACCWKVKWCGVDDCEHEPEKVLTAALEETR